MSTIEQITIIVCVVIHIHTIHHLRHRPVSLLPRNQSQHHKRFSESDLEKCNYSPSAMLAKTTIYCPVRTVYMSGILLLFWR